MWNWKFYIFWCNGRNGLFFGIIFYIVKIIINFLELISATGFLCILQTQLTGRNTSIPKNLENVNTWLSWWHHQMMTKVTFVKFFIKTYSILPIQYMYKSSCKMDKDFLRYSMFFHCRLLGHSPALRLAKKPSSCKFSWFFRSSTIASLKFYCLISFRILNWCHL